MLPRPDNADGCPKIAYVVKRYPRFSETFIVNELLAHQDAGAEVEIFSLRPTNDTHFQDVISRVRAPVTYLPHAGLKAKEVWEMMRKYEDQSDRLFSGLEAGWNADIVDLYQAMVLAQHVNKRGIQHIHAHFASSPATVARLAARFANIRYSITAHAKDIFHEDVDPNELVTKLEDAATVITVSDYNEHHLHALTNWSGVNIVRIYNGLDLETFEYSPPRNRPPLILAVGRLVEKKGFRHLIDACAQMASDGRPFRCRIVGSGPDELSLHLQISRLGLEERVVLAGPLPQAEIRREIQQAAVFAAPCVVGEDGNRDGLPTTLLEAMALGTPCVSTPVTGIPEAVLHDRTGIIVPQCESRSLAEGLARLLDDPGLRVRFAEAARKRIEEEFDVAQSAFNMREIFSKVTSGRVSRQRA